MAGAFAIKSVAGHSAVKVPQCYVQPGEEAVERGIQEVNRFNVGTAEGQYECSEKLPCATLSTGAANGD
jgi:hypothetical protein